MSVDHNNLNPDTEHRPSDRLGMPRVVAYRRVDSSEYGLPSHENIYTCTIEDPYIENLERTNPGRFGQIQQQEADYANLAQTRHNAGLWQRRKGVAYDIHGNEVGDPCWGDSYSRSVFTDFLDDGAEAHAAWLRNLPHASTLSYLSHPYAANYIDNVIDDVEVPVIIGETLKEWWISCSDAVGIRSRAGVMASLISDYANSCEDGLRTWTSVASGTAAPVLESATSLGLNPNMTLVDYDQTALDYAKRAANDLGFKGSVRDLQYNIFDKEQLARLPGSQIIDLMGIFEYINDELKAIGIDIEPEDFLRACYDFLEPGGRLIFGQMRDDRPNSYFTMGVIGWRYITQRSPKEVMNIVEKAGIPTNEVSVFLPEDGVYGVYSIDKPRLKSI